MTPQNGAGATVSGKEVRTLQAGPKHEAYSFVCLRCGHAWEDEYEIRHATDRDGHARVTYLCKGFTVPSPLTAGRCRTCGGERIRILRAGRVASARPSFD